MTDLTVVVELMNEHGETRHITATAATVDEAVALAEAHAERYPTAVETPLSEPTTWAVNDWWAA